MSGMYFLEVEIDGERKYVEKILIAREMGIKL